MNSKGCQLLTLSFDKSLNILHTRKLHSTLHTFIHSRFQLDMVWRFDRLLQIRFIQNLYIHESHLTVVYRTKWNIVNSIHIYDHYYCFRSEEDKESKFQKKTERRNVTRILSLHVNIILVFTRANRREIFIKPATIHKLRSI